MPEHNQLTRRSITYACRASAATSLFVFGAVYFLSVNWDWPVRTWGAYESYESGQAFPGSAISVAPDGSRLVYASPETGRGDIYSMRLDGTNRSRLTYDAEYEGNPCFSPNGEVIAFEREEHRRCHIWLMNQDGSSQRQLTVGCAYDKAARFAPDGEHIWFVRRFAGSRVEYDYVIDSKGHDLHELKFKGHYIGRDATYPTAG